MLPQIRGCPGGTQKWPTGVIGRISKNKKSKKYGDDLTKHKHKITTQSDYTSDSVLVTLPVMYTTIPRGQLFQGQFVIILLPLINGSFELFAISLGGS